MTVLPANKVLCARSRHTDYSTAEDSLLPEFGNIHRFSPAWMTFRSLLRDARLDYDNYGKPKWNPLSTLIKKGERVLIKPNWVHHENRSGAGLVCLVTHSTVVEVILAYVLKAQPASIIIGDAPIQGCDFQALLSGCELPEMMARFKASQSDVSIRDFRRTILSGGRLANLPIENVRPFEAYVLFDLGRQSNLEPLSGNGGFRVTMYNPDILQRTHSKAKHLYLVAREVLDADVVINVPKLKTHKKVALTGALKNAVGINGHKEYLPHHRKGDPSKGGDCYPTRSRMKSIIEEILDAMNRAKNPGIRSALSGFATGLLAINGLLGNDSNIEGSWYGNDTAWRMCLDLQQILHYGQPDGTLANTMQRRVITVTDAIIAGQGEGPLAPTPAPVGMMTLGTNTAAIDWVHGLLMGFHPESISLIRQAFNLRQHRLANFNPDEIVVEMDGRQIDEHELIDNYSYSFQPPRGWKGHCERKCADSANFLVKHRESLRASD